jgi:hypothetical protein
MSGLNWYPESRRAWVYAIVDPSGDQAGSPTDLSRTPIPVPTSPRSAPVAIVRVTISVRKRSRVRIARWNASVEPSGDHAGE